MEPSLWQVCVVFSFLIAPILEIIAADNRYQTEIPFHFCPVESKLLYIDHGCSMGSAIP